MGGQAALRTDTLLGHQAASQRGSWALSWHSAPSPKPGRKVDMPHNAYDNRIILQDHAKSKTSVM